MSICDDLTIAIPVLNEGKNLKGCLDAIGNDFAKQVIIIDSGSTDDTKEIALKFGADIIDFSWDGKFPKKRNWYLANHTPKTKWVLFLDADEYITEKLKIAICKAIATNNKAGYWLSYSVYFLGKPLMGGYPLRKLALFQVALGRYEAVSDEEKWSNLDMEIHEHVILEGEAGKIATKIDHRDYRGITHYVTKHNEYSDWEAKQIVTSIITKGPNQTWTLGQKVKYKLVRSPLIGVIYFFGSYIFMGGFLDGWRGLAFAILKMSYFTQIYAKVKEQTQYKLS